MSISAPNHIRVWRFNDAPDELKALSNHGGDEDWLALVPPLLVDEYIPWIEESCGFGRCCVSVHTHPELSGYHIRIGAHA